MNVLNYLAHLCEVYICLTCLNISYRGGPGRGAPAGGFGGRGGAGGVGGAGGGFKRGGGPPNNGGSAGNAYNNEFPPLGDGGRGGRGGAGGGRGGMMNR